MADETNKLSFVEQMLAEAKEAPQRASKKFAPILPEMSAESFNRRNIPVILGHLFAFCERLEEQVRKMPYENMGGREFERSAQPAYSKAEKIQKRLAFFDNMIHEKNVLVRQEDMEELTYIQDSLLRIEFTLFAKKMEAQKIPSLRSLEDEWIKKILDVQNKNFTYELELPVYVYEYGDLRDVTTTIPILSGFEHNGVFTGVFRATWKAQDQKVRSKQIKKLARKVASRLRMVRIVDQDGRLMGECKGRNVELY